MPATRAPDPDLVLLADRIHLLGDRPPVTALLLRGGRVAAAGTEAEVRAAALSGARTERLPPGVTVSPGLTDAHVHLSTWALARRRVELHHAATLEAGLETVRGWAEANPGAEWVRGLGWDANRWGRFPGRAELDAIVPDRPVYLESHDIHAAWLNSEGLRRCGITRNTPDPEGGEIERDPLTGEPTGILKENAKWLADRRLPEPSADEVRDALLDAQREAHRLGLTGVHSVEIDGWAHWGDLLVRDLLRLRVLQTVPLGRLDAAIELGLRSGVGGEWLRQGGVKMFLDGALGSRTAWLRAPYEGTDDRGIQTLSAEEFRETVRRAAGAGISSTVHAIGDAAVELALDVLSAVPAPSAMPHRIEHVQLCPPDLWERMGRSGLVGSVQPVHLMSDIAAAEQHWAHERSRGAYPFAALQRAGMTLAFGSDVPVESCDPRLGLFAATCRVGWDGEPAGGWFPEHGLSADAALRAYTEGPAIAAGEAGHRGRLLPGYDADLVAWSVDPLTAERDALREMRCVLTMVGGEVVHRDA